MHTIKLKHYNGVLERSGVTIRRRKINTFESYREEGKNQTLHWGEGTLHHRSKGGYNRGTDKLKLLENYMQRTIKRMGNYIINLRQRIRVKDKIVQRVGH